MLIKNAKIATGVKVDIQIESGLIEQVSSQIDGEADLDLAGEYFISPGWIDIHAHAFNQYEFIGDDIDTIGVQMGVTTLFDAGTVGALEISKFRTEVETAKTDVFLLMNISKIGIKVQNELADLANVDLALFEQIFFENQDLIKGIKARMSGSVVEKNGIKPLILAKNLQEKLGLPLMIHVGNPNPDLDDILQMCGDKDILTHCFHGKKSNIFDNSQQTLELLKAAQSRGLKLDIGHGTASFSFSIFKRAQAIGLQADTISTDIYRRNRKDGPVFDFATTISKFLNLGYTHEEIIEKITNVPAKLFNLTDRGCLETGKKGDLTIYKIEEIKKSLVDSDGNEIQSEQLFVPKYVVKNEEIIKIGDWNGYLYKIWTSKSNKCKWKNDSPRCI
ncbi:MAG: amidohydrolase/deacetylase family metallohydrolase [Mycoplasmatales bacterium]